MKYYSCHRNLESEPILELNLYFNSSMNYNPFALKYNLPGMNSCRMASEEVSFIFQFRPDINPISYVCQFTTVFRLAIPMEWIIRYPP